MSEEAEQWRGSTGSQEESQEESQEGSKVVYKVGDEGICIGGSGNPECGTALAALAIDRSVCARIGLSGSTRGSFTRTLFCP